MHKNKYVPGDPNNIIENFATVFPAHTAVPIETESR